MARFKVAPWTIENVLNCIKNNEIAIPELQRPFVWDGTKIRNLIDSLYQGYPVGYLIIWQNPNLQDKDGNSTNGKKIMIDGQQRVTALMAAIAGQKVYDKQYHKKRYAISFNPNAEEGSSPFEVLRADIQKDNRWIKDISELFSTDFSSRAFLNSYEKLNPDADIDRLEKLINGIKNIVQTPIGVIELDNDLPLPMVSEIFKRINSEGSPLTQTDFVMSTIAANNDQNGNCIRKTLDYFFHSLKSVKFLDQVAEEDKEFAATDYYKLIYWVNNTHQMYQPSIDDIIRIAFMSQYDRAKVESLVELLNGRNFDTRKYENDILADSYDKFKAGIIDTLKQYNFTQFVELLKTAGFIIEKMLKARMPLVFAYMLFIRLSKDSSIDKLKIQHYVQKWYVLSLLTSRYSSSPETTMESDLREIKSKGFVNFFQDALANLGETFWNITIPQNLQSSSTSTPAYVVYLAAQCKMGDDAFLGNGAKVSFVIESGDVHHLFPKKYLQKNGYDNVVQYNQVANLAVLSTPINISINDSAPCEYLKKTYDDIAAGVETRYTTLKTLQELEINLRDNSIPINMKDMDASRYDEFLKERRVLMAQKIKKYFDSL